ncbi:hypothetical protein OVY01_00985 [Robbsia sp. Bb-Pol-6]|uniref:Uncharacterized protein n=1 Tax=Robbsia betulipollinis TaxID=2981849 RepID=A0ABT3ZH29_9BURK|nr:hypothetical protein [Robbsia betulipollinis]MCY0385836.1 hypothetical protein [Robbsia betulipollinis]
MMNITRSANLARQRIKVRVPSAPAVHHTATLPAQAWMIGVGLALAVGAVMYAGAAHADEGLTTCADAAPTVLAKRPAAGISYAPHHPIHRHHVPAVLRKPAPGGGCTLESLPAAVPPLSVPAVADASDPAEVIPPVPAAMSLLSAAPAVAAVPDPVVPAAIAPVSMETPRGAVAAAALGDPKLAAVPLLVLATGIAVCVVGHACGGHSSTTGGHSVSTAGTTGTVGK